MKVGLVSTVLSIIISPVFVWKWGVFGLASSIIISSIVGRTFSLRVLREKYNLLPDLRHAVRTLLSSVVSAGVSYGVVRFLSGGSPFLSLFLGSGIFLVTYLFLVSLMGVIEERDIKNIDSMLKGVVVIYPFVRLLLKFESKILELTFRQKKS